MRNLSSKVFNAAVEKEFSFLLDREFLIKSDGRTDTPLTAGVLFVGKNVAIQLGLDRRDECIDCYVGAVRNGVAKPWDQAHGYWGHFSGFLVSHRGYRGSFRQFDVADKSAPEYLRALRMYATALKTLGKGIIDDAPNVFVVQREPREKVGG